MNVIHDLRQGLAACHAAGHAGLLGLVPTMGALHSGHLSLVARARAECDTVAVTIFVNPLQFGPGEDLSRYPRRVEQDCEQLAASGADLVLVLDTEQMYPDDFATQLRMDTLTGVLEGAARPGHFDGVLTVVAKLFGIAGPCRAFFGRKDFQQTVVVKRLVSDLHLPVDVVVCETRRDADGLALSSRNAYLSPAQRQRGLALVAALTRCQQLFDAGQADGPTLTAAMQTLLSAGLQRAPDYAAVVDAVSLAPVERARAGHVAVVAGRVGSTRLLDNHVLGGPLSGFPEA
ncbi:MAG: pantoate--beta-alanine ligase [Planctomycetota bacterium]|nr:MAG: pantoate--beta-alanine ligase [Planctomycetota bacterium]